MNNINYREDQLPIISYENGTMAVPAVPGAGKTFIVTNLVAKLLCENKHKGGKILILTYMNSAVSNFKGRIKKILQDNEIKEENGESTNDTYVYLDIPEAERLESMYFGFKQYGSDLASGKLEMKMGYNLDRKTILEGQKFEFENLSLAAFSQAFTGNYERDYTELDKQIYDIIKNGTGDEIQTIENNLDGLKETITITDDFLFYKLESRVYNFK